MHILVTY